MFWPSEAAAGHPAARFAHQRKLGRAESKVCVKLKAARHGKSVCKKKTSSRCPGSCLGLLAFRELAGLNESRAPAVSVR